VWNKRKKGAGSICNSLGGGGEKGWRVPKGGGGGGGGVEKGGYTSVGESPSPSELSGQEEKKGGGRGWGGGGRLLFATILGGREKGRVGKNGLGWGGVDECGHASSLTHRGGGLRGCGGRGVFSFLTITQAALKEGGKGWVVRKRQG